MQRKFQNLRSPSEFSPVSTPLVSLGDPTGSVFTLGSMGLNLIPQTQAMGFNKGIPYPGLDGHPRRITPIPVSVGPIQSDEMREGYAQLAKTVFGAEIHDPAKTEASTEWTSGASKPTIGETSISTQEANKIREEVRVVMREQFAEGRAAL